MNHRIGGLDLQKLIGHADPYLVMILLLSITLNVAGIWTINMANPYYMASIVSMSQNFHNFFFASFDPAGFVSIDKPPLAFWIQTVSALLFGIHGWSVILPQALAGTGSVLIIYLLIRPSFGLLSARIAALILAITPVAVAVARTNNVDSLLVFFLMIAALFLFKSCNENSESRRWLYLSFAFIGLAFNIKMLEAYMILPAFIFLYLISSEQAVRKRIAQLTMALIIMISVSLSWAMMVDAVSSQARPFIGSSLKNSETDLAFGYNGAQRLTGQSTGLNSETESNNPAASMGLARLFRVGYGTQISWFLPFVFLGIPFVLIQLRKKSRKNWYKKRTGRETLFWIAFLLPAFTVFSFAGFFHRYYFVMIAPPIAALCGIVLPVMYQRFHQLPGLRPAVFPVSLFAVLLLQTIYIGYYHLFIGILFAIIGFSLLYLKIHPDKMPHLHTFVLKHVGAALWILLAILPLYWSLTPALYGGNNALPEAGPQLKYMQGAVQKSSKTDDHLIHYLSLHQTAHAFLFGTTDAPTAAPYIIRTGKPVMAVGGFNGTDPILTPAALEQMIHQKKIRYFYFPSDNQAFNTPIERWIRTHGKQVPERVWLGSLPSTRHGQAGQLYDLYPAHWVRKYVPIIEKPSS
jgi:4-amino-4-deoxy-L-arabinose transferase and related glycosyltransferases of PMT family